MLVLFRAAPRMSSYVRGEDVIEAVGTFGDTLQWAILGTHPTAKGNFMSSAPSDLIQPTCVSAIHGDAPAERLSYRNLPMLLLRVREKMMLYFRPILTTHGLTEQQWRIIRALNEHGPLESRHIADLCTISTPSLAGVLARMETKDWVKKTRLAHDQRRVRVSLTARSRKLVSSIATDLQAAYVELERCIGARLLAETYNAVDGLLAGLEAKSTPDGQTRHGMTTAHE